MKLSDGFWRRFSLAILLGLAAGVTLAFLSADGLSIAGGSLGGDYPAFYAAGKIIAEGQGAALYDVALQERMQQGLHADGDRGFLIFAYPAYVALFYAPLSYLPFLVSFALYMAVLAAAAVATVRLVRPMLPECRGQGPVLLLLLAACYPLLASILGGQNTALSLLLLAAIWRALHDERDVLAGLAVGLLLFKPQFGLPVLLLLLVGRRFRVLLGVVPVAAACYLLGLWAAGADWPLQWLQAATQFRSVTHPLDRETAVSIMALLNAYSDGVQTMTSVGLLPSAALGLALAVAWARRVLPMDGLLVLSACAVVVLAPHAIFYDAGLAALALLFLFDRAGGRLTLPLALLVLANWTALASPYLGFNPLIIVLIVTVALVIRRATAPAA